MAVITRGNTVSKLMFDSGIEPSAELNYFLVGLTQELTKRIRCTITDETTRMLVCNTVINCMEGKEYE